MSGNDVRVNNPGGTSIYESLTLKPSSGTQEPQKTQAPKETPAKLETKDNNVIEEQKGSNSVKNVNFVEGFNPPPNSAPLIDPETNKPYLFKTDEKGIPLMNDKGEFLIDEENGVPGFVKVDDKGNAVGDENGNLIFVETIGKVPAKGVSFGENNDDLPPLMELGSTDQPKQNDSKPEVMTVPLANLETGQPVKLKVDDTGYPLLDDNGQFIPDDKDGKVVWVQVDKNSGEPLMKDGKMLLGSPPPEAQMAESMQKALSAHSAQRLLQGHANVHFAKWGVSKVATSLVTGVSMKIPFTTKAVGFGVKHAVAKAVTEEIAKVTASKAGSTTVVSAIKGSAKTVTETTTKALTEAGKLGKGIQTLTMKEATGVAGKLINPKNAVEFASKVPGVVAKSGAETVAHVSANGVVKTVQKTMVGAGEKVLKEGVEKGIEKGVQIAIKRGGTEIAEKVITKGTEKAIVKAAEKAAVTTAAKTTAKVGSRLAGAVPVIGAVGGAAITAWDTKDAIEKSKDPKASTASKALAWTTVGLDAVSTAAVATGIGAPIGWIATGLSIGTSVLSDYLR